MRILRILAATLTFAGLLSGCGGDSGPTTDTADASTSFVAFQRDFQDFHHWEAFSLPATDASFVPHLAGARIVYLNRRPPAGSTAFPVGTIIVKEMQTQPVDERDIFAMVKRGDGYNSSGANGWEWFQLSDFDDGSVGIVWRGVRPPSGESYAGDPNANCNTCHAAAVANDFVQNNLLNLGKL